MNLKKIIIYALVIICFIGLYNLVKKMFFPSQISLINETQKKRRIRVFYINEEGYCEAEERDIMSGATILDDIKTSLDEMSKKPLNDKLSPAVPQGSEIRSVFVDEKGCAYLDFKRNLSDKHPGGTVGELNTIKAIVRTVASNFHDIKNIRILMEGKDASTIAGHVDIRGKIKTK